MSVLLMVYVLGLLQDKKSLKLGPEDNLHLEGFALNVFGKADKQDRDGWAEHFSSCFALLLWNDTYSNSRPLVDSFFGLS